MRRLVTSLAALAVCLLGLPAAAHAAAPDPLGSGNVLFNPLGPINRQCTAAFAVTDGVNGYLLAGPTCNGGTLYSSTSSGGMAVVGTVIKPVVPYNGWSLVEVTNTTDWELVPWVLAGNTKIVLTGSAETKVGGKVCLAGPTTGLRCGTVDATDQTATFPWGTGTGLTRTSICVGQRNLGAAYLTDDQAQGIPLGGASDICTTPGASFFVPINPILDKYDLKLLTG
jgi:streptogrisin C